MGEEDTKSYGKQEGMMKESMFGAAIKIMSVKQKTAGRMITGNVMQ